MQQTMNAGAVFFKDGTLFPEHFKCDSESYSPGWRSVQGIDGYELDRKIHDTGWHCFYFAGEYKVTALGREGQKTNRKAIAQIQTLAKSENTNAFEITRVAHKTFLGIPYTSLSFHMRNIQEGMLLPGDAATKPWKDTL